MVELLSIILFLVFISLGLIHFYWLADGKWGLGQVIPMKPDEEAVLPPPKLATLLVALVLIGFGILYLVKSGAIDFEIPTWVSRYGYWVVPAIFTLRAVGEFQYVGFFKRIKNTKFAKADTNIFSPLCLGIGIVGVIIQLFDK